MQLSKCTLVLGVGTLKDVGKQGHHTGEYSKVLRLQGLREHSDFLIFNLKNQSTLQASGFRVPCQLPARHLPNLFLLATGISVEEGKSRWLAPILDQIQSASISVVAYLYPYYDYKALPLWGISDISFIHIQSKVRNFLKIQLNKPT